MKKYRINDISSDNNGSQQQLQQQNGVESRQLQALQALQERGQQRIQLTQNIQNRIQRRYEADGSEEEEMRANQLLHQSIGSQSLQSFGGQQRNMNCVSSDEHLMQNIDSCNIDATTLYSKLKELQEAEARLKQVEDLMRSIEKMENNIKEVKRDSLINNDSRKTSNENLTKFMTRNTGNNASHNMTKTSIKTVSSQPKQLSHSSNNILTNPQQKNIVSRNIDENNIDLNTTSQQLLPQTIDLSDNNVGYNTDLDESESTSEESFNLLNGNLIRSMRSQFDSMRSQFETMLPVLENQFTNTNINTNTNNSNNNNNYINNQQFFHLMLLQNYQIMQQQQMLLLWLQQQQQPQQPLHQPHNPHHYFNVRQSNISSIPQNSLHYRNSTLNSSRNNDVNAHNVTAALNNQVVPGVRANNYWDNFKSYSRQNKLSTSTNTGVNTNNISSMKGNENLLTANNQMVSPIIGTDQQIIHNANQCQDLNTLSPSATLLRHSYKAANASHVQCVEHVEKQQNLPLNDSIHCKQTHSPQIDSNNFAALFSMLEKLIENDEKYVTKSATKKKATNLVITADNEEDCGAVGGIGPTNVVNNQTIAEESIDSKSLCASQPTQSSRTQLSANLPIPLHIPASSGAIRKKPRNQEILELTSKAENSDSFGLSLVNGSEMIRPLMPAEGRSSEIAVSNIQVVPIKTSQKGQILSVRPPTTGAPGYKDCDSGSNVSSDDDLAEADQTTVDLINSESETIYNNNAVNTISAQTNVANVLISETCQRSVNEDNSVIITNGNEELEEEEDDDDTILDNSSNESGIRLSGDGEQGL
jgi:hypothetical protein